MPYDIIPIQHGPLGWSVPDEALVDIWRQIEAENKVAQLFYGGGMETAADFTGFIKSGHIVACIVLDLETRSPRAIGWLTNASGGSAFVHYCVLGRPRRSAGKALLDYWSNMRGPDGQRVFRVLLGITPETHTACLRVIQIMGFTKVGTIPNYCNCAYEGAYRGAVVCYYECPSS